MTEERSIAEGQEKEIDVNIEVVIPYKAGGDLGSCYNEYMEGARDWVLFVDHDVLILRPEWHEMCVAAIRKLGRKAGWISAVTNRIYCPDQRRTPPGDTDDIVNLIEFSNGLYKISGPRVVKPSSGVPFSGFFLLTNREAWEAAGGFNVGFLGVDNAYYNALIEAGYEAWVMPGLFCYHIYNRKQLFAVPQTNVVQYIKDPPAKPEKLSVCMIAKNEQEVLPRCLESVKSIADEIIFVDTGSTDATIGIAKSFGAYVHNHPWQDSFSLHRNQSVKYATGDWLLFIDADEKLCGNIQELKNWLAAVPAEINAISVSMVDIQNGQEAMRFNSAKIFRRGQVTWEGIVHNQPKYEGESLFCDVVFYKHYGYALSPEKMKEKSDRRIRLLEKRIADNPDDFAVYFYLSMAHGFDGRWDKMAEYAEKYLALKDKMIRAGAFFDSSIYFSAIRAYLQHLDRIDDAKRWINIALANPENITIDIAFAMVEYGVRAHDYEYMSKGAQAYLKLYIQFERGQAAAAKQFVYTYKPQCAAYCLFHLSCNQIKSGAVNLQKLHDPLFRIPKDFLARTLAMARSELNQSGLDFLTVEPQKIEKKA